MSAGRPSKFERRFVAMAAKACRMGATNVDLAEFFGVAVSTIGEWLATQPKFSDAVKGGRAEADNRVERALFERATGYSHPAVKIMQYEGEPVTVDYTEHYAPDTAACIWWLKNRQPGRWREKQVTPVAVGTTLPPAEQARQVLAEVAAGRLAVHDGHELVAAIERRAAIEHQDDVAIVVAQLALRAGVDLPASLRVRAAARQTKGQVQ